MSISVAPVLLIGGLDSSGGAGLIRDAAAVSAMGGQARFVATALTAQSDSGVGWVAQTAPDGVRAQFCAATQGAAIGAIKIGMLGDAQGVSGVAQAVRNLPDPPRVLDPVIRASSGGMLLSPAGLRALKNDLLPQLDLITPNLPELAALGDLYGLSTQDPAAIARALMANGPGAVLAKGGHGEAVDGMICDVLYLRDGGVIRFPTRRFAFEMRGTGCFLASAIAASLARRMGADGDPAHAIVTAISEAKAALTLEFERRAAK
jgi:hydroxymethylpyrimidine/phosphomethylpyrimidine kinase